MRSDRRRFLQVVGGATAAGMFGPSMSLAGGGGPPLLRKSLADLNATSPEIVTLGKAVQAMKALPASNPRSWAAQSAIHGSIATGFGNCRHGSWFFLPWHRAYIWYFEQIVRTLGGDPTFTLPYWNWSVTQKIPGFLFGGNLDNPARPGVPQSGRRKGPTDAFTPTQLTEFVGTGRIASILNTTDFETFGGGAVDTIHDRSFAGELEASPHNFVHTWVGGDMATGGSPFDPLFWMHHCNVDRLWSEWTIKHPTGTPGDSKWLNGDFANHFVDGAGTAVTSIKVSQLLDTTALGYTYRATPPSPPPPGGGGGSILASLKANASPVDADVLGFDLTTNEDVRRSINSVASGEGQRPSLRLVISGIMTPKNPEVSLRVFVNCLKIAKDTPVDDPSYVGSCAFFSHGHGGNQHEHGDEISWALNVSPVFQKLYGDRNFDEKEPLRVSVIAVPLSGDGEASIQEINPKNVRFEVVSSRLALS